MQKDPTPITDFGFKKIPRHEKANQVKAVFDSVAFRYDMMNDLMSLGAHRIWKKIAIELTGAREGHRILDVASGTGDLAKKLSKIVKTKGCIVISDINDEMLFRGRDKLTDQGIVNNLTYLQADAQNLPFENDAFDCVTIGFGLRNVTDKEAALRSMYRVLKPGGRLIILEFSKPTNSILQSFYDAYSFKILPTLGKWIANDSDSYQYLVESIRMHPDQPTLKQMMEKADFESCEYFNMTGGIVAIHRGYKY